MKCAFIIYALLCWIYVQCRKLPDIPCPNVFRYAEDNGIIYGLIDVKNDYSGLYEIVVNVSLATLLDKSNIQIYLLTPTDELNNGANPVYRVDFPIQEVIPKITQIIYNNKVYCFGDPEPLSNRGVTNMWAKKFLRTNIIPKNHDFTQYQRIEPNENFYGSSYRPVESSITASNDALPSPSVRFPSRASNQPNRRIPIEAFPKTSAFVNATPSPSPAESSTIRKRDELECGLFSQQLIVGGTETVIGEFPWIVAILIKLHDSYSYICTGNLITNRHILSAGHCFNLEKPTYKKGDFVFVLGKQNIYQWAIQSTLRGIKEMHIHDKFMHGTADYDIAVVTMDNFVEFSDLIRPICVWSKNENYDLVGKNGTVVGWGTDGHSISTQKAKKIDLTVISNEECLRSHWSYANLTSERTFCAGGKGVGPCNGDSGAGIVMQRKDRWTLRGIVSQALVLNGKCDLLKYIVFVDVEKFTDWIEEIILK